MEQQHIEVVGKLGSTTVFVGGCVFIHQPLKAFFDYQPWFLKNQKVNGNQLN